MPQASIPGSTLVLIFIIVLLDGISSQFGIYSDDTTIYTCLVRKSDQFVKVKSASGLKKKNELHSVVNWGKERL